MRIALLTLNLIAACTAPFAIAEDKYSTSEFSIERWDEDYSGLKPPAKHTVPFDPLKYVPLSLDRDWYLSFGGQLRERYQYFNNSSFGGGMQDENGFLLTRILAHVDAHFGENLRGFLQFDSGIISDRAGGPRPGDADDFDVQQGFVDVRLPFGDSKSATLRLGRQELIYGAQRLISPNDWGNVRRTFDGAKVSFNFGGDLLDVFWTRPVVQDKTRFNGNDDHEWFAGVYNVTALPGVLPGGDSKADLYLLALENARSITHAMPAETYTTGARFHTTPTPWDFDVEGDWQFGSVASQNVHAWSVAVAGGYRFVQVPLQPRVFVGLDAASGSQSAGGRFNQLFPPQFLYLGHMNILGRTNLIDAHGGVDFAFPHDVSLELTQHVFWRQNRNDAIYNFTGGVVRAENGSGASYVGTEFDAFLNWPIQRNVSAYIGYGHFFAGSFIRQTGPDSDIDFLFTAVTFTF